MEKNGLSQGGGSRSDKKSGGHYGKPSGFPDGLEMKEESQMTMLLACAAGNQWPSTVGWGCAADEAEFSLAGACIVGGRGRSGLEI